jgi:hypothetical protein
MPIAVISILRPIAHWVERKYVPPQNIVTVADVIKWTGRPEWIMKYSSETQTYYEIARKEHVTVALLRAASGPPSYTVDAKGRFVGWTPDSGEIRTPEIVWTPDMKKEDIDVDQFLEQAKKMYRTKGDGRATNKIMYPFEYK